METTTPTLDAQIERLLTKLTIVDDGNTERGERQRKENVAYRGRWERLATAAQLMAASYANSEPGLPYLTPAAAVALADLLTAEVSK